jgi:hypothetical protein
MNKKNFTLILLVLIIFISILLSSCSLLFPRIEGIVLSTQNGTPLEHVKISLVHSTVHTYTNKEGVFILYLYTVKKPKYVDISVFKEGYQIRILRVYLNEKGIGKIEISLEKATDL